MKKVIFRNPVIMLSALLFPGVLFAQHQPITLNRINPHYFEFNNSPVMLITSAEHYGAVINTGFDYIAYLDELRVDGFNLTRVFSGAYLERQDPYHIAGNTLAPAPGQYLSPWPRSKVPGYANGGNRFDLSRWNPQYFSRLKKFVAAANQRNIFVEFTFFCPFYEESQWKLSPLNPLNNINNHGPVSRKEVYSVRKNNPLLPVEVKMVKKIVTALRKYDNVLYEICNEPYASNISAAWQHDIAKVIFLAEERYGVHHLITQNVANKAAIITDPDPLVSVFNFHYASPPITVYENYHLNKVIGNNETGFKGQADSTYRRVAWQFILAGGGLFNNLDYSFSAGYERGTFHYPASQPGGGSATLRRQLGYLKRFMAGLDFIHMHPDTIWLTEQLPHNTSLYVLDETGRQYAAYLCGGHPEVLYCHLPPGDYTIQWMDPVTGAYTSKKTFRSEGTCRLQVPDDAPDAALKILKTKETVK